MFFIWLKNESSSFLKFSIVIWHSLKLIAENGKRAFVERLRKRTKSDSVLNPKVSSKDKGEPALSVRL